MIRLPRMLRPWSPQKIQKGFNVSEQQVRVLRLSQDAEEGARAGCRKGALPGIKDAMNHEEGGSMASGMVKRILERGWRERVDTGGKHSSLLNAMFLAGFHDWFQEKIAEVLRGPVITHPNLADSSSRIRPLVLAGKIKEALQAAGEFRRQRVLAGGVTQHTTAPSTAGWVFADTAYMVPPSQAIVGAVQLAVSDLKGLHRILAQENGLLRHVYNLSLIHI